MKASAISSTPTIGAPVAPSRRSVDRFRLTGRSVVLDRRVHAVRADIADVALADRIFAPHYASPDICACTTRPVPMRSRGSHDAAAVSELLPGERFAVLDMTGGWAWGYACHDNYVGYVPADALGPIGPAPTHVVTAARALVFAAADIKAPLIDRPAMGFRVAGDVVGDFLALAGGGFIHLRYLAAIDAVADPVASALRLVGTPYLWGGRSGAGIDCSGLVQLAYSLAGIALPRDSDQQQAATYPTDEIRSGTLAFWPGHVGLMRDATHLIHANAHAMAVTVEPLTDVTARIGVAPTLRRVAA